MVGMRILASVILLLSLAGPASAAELTGRASVIDGDTIDIRNERIRLHGIDAPESAQWCLDGAGQGYRCGQQAAFALADRIGAQNIRCDLLDRDRYGRHIGRCFLGEADLNAWMVRQGQAVAYRRFSTEYVAVEEAARRDEIGLWQGDFDLPWDWRRGDRRILQGGTVADTAASDAGCAIKGNISRSGERIYHVPGQQHYERTRVDESSGERWFCSEEEAQAAGWRRAKR
jgi:endonuclease YncB( thermonuclease family)